MGFGNFSSRGETDMILRNVNTGGVEVYDISNNQITGATFMGTVGLGLAVLAASAISAAAATSDMLLRNSNTGGLEVYDIANNQITNAAFIGTVGLDWQFSGVGNFSGSPRRNRSAVAQHQYRRIGSLRHRQQPDSPARPSSARWAWIGSSPAIAPIHAAGASDLVLRNVNTGAFEVYDIANNQITSAPPAWVRSAWIGSSAASPPIRRRRRAHSRMTRQPLSSCKRWRALAAAAAQPMV